MVKVQEINFKPSALGSEVQELYAVSVNISGAVRSD